MENLKNIHCTVVLPTKDRVDMARTVLRSILNQTIMINQIVIVDDGSVIPASTSLAPELHIFESNGIDIVYIRHETSKGVSAARNAGIQNAHSEIIFFCDSDDYWHPQKVEICLQHFIDNPKSDVFIHSFRWVDGTQLIFRLLPEGRIIKFPRLLALLFSFANPSCLCVRIKDFKYRFDESKRYHEDLDFILHVMKSHSVTFRNSFLMTMGRAPGDSGGATQNLAAMRQGAIAALQDKSTNVFEWIILNFKVTYHRLRLWSLH